ncbi:MAG: alpha/beta fold hydrolase [Hyphomicrobiales bacterium]
MTARSSKIEFSGSQGHKLAARLEMPGGTPRAFALFAHCFTCSKDVFAASRIAGRLSELGIATLRFDFTGLGSSDGEFANTDFSSNIEDLVRAADWLRQEHQAPSILVGHSLGGTAVLAAAGEIPEAVAVATIGAPFDAAHVVESFAGHLDEIERTGQATVELAGRQFRIRQDFVDDVRTQNMQDRIAGLGRALIVFHAPRDEIVGIDNAGAIFSAAKHPKSFISLDDADHLLTRRADAVYVADVLATWAGRYLADAEADTETQATASPSDPRTVRVAETGANDFQQDVIAAGHRLLADEPVDMGGLGSGPSPYDLLAAALGACTSMTLRMYATRKNLDLGRITVDVTHGKVHARDCVDCAEGLEGRIDRFERTISIDGSLSADLDDKLVEIAGKCPVHRTLEAGSAVVTKISRGS